jgi:predicted O-methyltransferase YrrM
VTVRRYSLKVIVGLAVALGATAVGYAFAGAGFAGLTFLVAAVVGALLICAMELSRIRAAHVELADSLEVGLGRLQSHLNEVREAQEKHLSRIADQLTDFQSLQASSRAGHEEALDQVRVSVDKTITRVRKIIQDGNRVVYAEVEDLLALYRDISPDRSLPTLHGWSVGADLARFLYSEVLERQRMHVLECGSGSTTVILAYAMQALGSGRVVALEHLPQFADATRRLLAERGLQQWAQVLDAPLVDVELDGEVWQWYDIGAIPAGRIDLLLVDGPPGTTRPQARYPAVPLLADRLADDALIVLDDARRSAERAVGERWLTQLPGYQSKMLKHDHGTLVFRRLPVP